MRKGKGEGSGLRPARGGMAGAPGGKGTSTAGLVTEKSRGSAPPEPGTARGMRDRERHRSPEPIPAERRGPYLTPRARRSGAERSGHGRERRAGPGRAGHPAGRSGAGGRAERARGCGRCGGCGAGRGDADTGMRSGIRGAGDAERDRRCGGCGAGLLRFLSFPLFFPLAPRRSQPGRAARSSGAGGDCALRTPESAAPDPPPRPLLATPRGTGARGHGLPQTRLPVPEQGCPVPRG